MTTVYTFVNTNLQEYIQSRKQEAQILLDDAQSRYDQIHEEMRQLELALKPVTVVYTPQNE